MSRRGIGHRARRLLVAGVLASLVPLGAGHAAGRTGMAPPSGVVAITDWRFPAGCGFPADAVSQEVCVPMQDQLFSYDNHQRLFPDLAQTLPTVRNGGATVVHGNLVVTYRLKPNLRWSDGTPLTARDVIFSVRVNLAAGNTLGLDQITAMKARDARTVQVTYHGIYAPYAAYGWPSLLFSQRYLQHKYGTTNITTIANKAIQDPYNSPRDVWSGPYKLQSWTTDQSIFLVPNPYYTALPPALGHPRLAQIKFITVTRDPASLGLAMHAGTVGADLVTGLQFDSMQRHPAAPYHVSAQPALTVEQLQLNLAGPLKDVRVRQALQYATAKRSLFSDLFPGVTNADDFLLRTVLPNSSPWVDARVPVSAYNPARARALLREAGYADQYGGPGRHLTLRLVTLLRPNSRQRVVQILSKEWAQVGIHVQATFVSGVATVPGSLFASYDQNGILARRRFDVAYFTNYELPDPQAQESGFDPHLIPTPAHHDASAQNYGGISDTDQFALLVRARHTLDLTQRHALFNQWQRLVNNRVYVIMLYANGNITADDGRIGNFKPNPTAVGDAWNAFEWYRT